MSGPGGESGHGEINRLPIMRADPVCRAATALTLAPVLAFGMWAAAIAGTGTAWNYSQPGQTNLVGVVGGFAFSALIPAVVLVDARAFSEACPRPWHRESSTPDREVELAAGHSSSSRFSRHSFRWNHLSRRFGEGSTTQSGSLERAGFTNGIN